MASDSDTDLLNNASIDRSIGHDDVSSSSDISIDGDDEKEGANLNRWSDDPLGCGRSSSRLTASSSSSSLSRQPIVYNDHWPKYFGLTPRGFQFVDHPSTSTGLDRAHPDFSADTKSSNCASSAEFDSRWTDCVDRRNFFDEQSSGAVASAFDANDLSFATSEQPQIGQVDEYISVVQSTLIGSADGESTDEACFLANGAPVLQMRDDADGKLDDLDDRDYLEYGSRWSTDVRRGSRRTMSKNDVMNNERCMLGDRMTIDSAAAAVRDIGPSELTASGIAEKSTATSPVSPCDPRVVELFSLFASLCFLYKCS